MLDNDNKVKNKSGAEEAKLENNNKNGAQGRLVVFQFRTNMRGKERWIPGKEQVKAKSRAKFQDRVE